MAPAPWGRRRCFGEGGKSGRERCLAEKRTALRGWSCPEEEEIEERAYGLGSKHEGSCQWR